MVAMATTTNSEASDLGLSYQTLVGPKRASGQKRDTKLSYCSRDSDPSLSLSLTLTLHQNFDPSVKAQRESQCPNSSILLHCILDLLCNCIQIITVLVCIWSDCSVSSVLNKSAHQLLGQMPQWSFTVFLRSHFPHLLWQLFLSSPTLLLPSFENK